MTTITSCGVENETTVCTMIELNSTMIHMVIGSTLAADCAAWRQHWTACCTADCCWIQSCLSSPKEELIGDHD